jgi:hypothetical protein
MNSPDHIEELIIQDNWSYRRTENRRGPLELDTSEFVLYVIEPPGMAHHIYLRLSCISFKCTGEEVASESYLKNSDKTPIDFSIDLASVSLSSDNLGVQDGVLVRFGPPPDYPSPTREDLLPGVALDEPGIITEKDCRLRQWQRSANEDLLGYLTVLRGRSFEMIEKKWPYSEPPRRVTFIQDSKIAGGKLVAVAFAPGDDAVWVVAEFSECDSEGTVVRASGDSDIMEELQALLARSNADVGEATRPEDTAQYVFRLTGDIWKVVFHGEELLPVRKLKGMNYLQTLLSHPGREFSALELYRLQEAPPPEYVSPPEEEDTLGWEDRERYGTGGQSQHVITPETRDSLIKKRDELRAELDNPFATPRDRERAADEIARIDKGLSLSRVAKASGGAIFEDKATKQPRQAVSKAIGGAIDAFAQHSPDLVKHLRTAVSKGRTLLYTSDLTRKT